MRSVEASNAFYIEANAPLLLTINLIDELASDEIVFERFLSDIISHESTYVKSLSTTEKLAATISTSIGKCSQQSSDPIVSEQSRYLKEINNCSLSPASNHGGYDDSSSISSQLIDSVIRILLPLIQSEHHSHSKLRDQFLDLNTASGRFNRLLTDSKKFETELNSKLVQEFQSSVLALSKAQSCVSVCLKTTEDTIKRREEIRRNESFSFPSSQNGAKDIVNHDMENDGKFYEPEAIVRIIERLYRLLEATVDEHGRLGLLRHHAEIYLTCAKASVESYNNLLNMFGNEIEATHQLIHSLLRLEDSPDPSEAKVMEEERFEKCAIDIAQKRRKLKKVFEILSSLASHTDIYNKGIQQAIVKYLGSSEKSLPSFSSFLVSLSSDTEYNAFSRSRSLNGLSDLHNIFRESLYNLIKLIDDDLKSQNDAFQAAIVRRSVLDKQYIESRDAKKGSAQSVLQTIKQPVDYAEIHKIMATLADNVADQDVLVASRLSSLTNQLVQSELQKNEKLYSDTRAFLLIMRDLSHDATQSFESSKKLLEKVDLNQSISRWLQSRLDGAVTKDSNGRRLWDLLVADITRTYSNETRKETQSRRSLKPPQSTLREENLINRAVPKYNDEVCTGEISDTDEGSIANEDVDLPYQFSNSYIPSNNSIQFAQQYIGDGTELLDHINILIDGLVEPVDLAASILESDIVQIENERPKMVVTANTDYSDPFSSFSCCTNELVSVLIAVGPRWRGIDANQNEGTFPPSIVNVPKDSKWVLEHKSMSFSSALMEGSMENKLKLSNSSPTLITESKGGSPLIDIGAKIRIPKSSVSRLPSFLQSEEEQFIERSIYSSQNMDRLSPVTPVQAFRPYSNTIAVMLDEQASMDQGINCRRASYSETTGHEKKAVEELCLVNFARTAEGATTAQLFDQGPYKMVKASLEKVPQESTVLPAVSPKIPSHSPVRSPRNVSTSPSGGSPTEATLRHLPPELIKSMGRPKLVPSSLGTAVKAELVKQPFKKLSEYTLEFKERFNLPDDEIVLAHYTCALSLRILLHGKLYITSHFVAFLSLFNDLTIFGTQPTVLLIPLNQIQDIRKKNNALIFPNSIEFLLQDGSTHFFASFLSRDKVYDFIKSIWDLSRETSTTIDNLNETFYQTDQYMLTAPISTTQIPDSKSVFTVPFAVTPNKAMEFPKGITNYNDLTASDRLRWRPWLDEFLQPPLPTSPLSNVTGIIRWKCSLSKVFVTIFGNKPKDVDSWCLWRYFEAIHCKSLIIEEWDASLPFDETTSEITRNAKFIEANEIVPRSPHPSSCPVGYNSPAVENEWSSEDQLTSQQSNTSKSFKHAMHFVIKTPATGLRSAKLKQRRKYKIGDSRLTTPRASLTIEETSEKRLEEKISSSTVDDTRRPQRRIQYLRKVNKSGLASLIKLPDYAQIEETWTLFVYSPRCVIIECRAKASGIPFAAYFTVITRFRLTALSELETQLDFEVDFEWTHSTFLRSKIEAEAYANLQEANSVFARLSCASLNPLGSDVIVSTPTTPKTGHPFHRSGTTTPINGENVDVIEVPLIHPQFLEQRGWIEKLIVNGLWYFGKTIQLIFWVMSFIVTNLISLSSSKRMITLTTALPPIIFILLVWVIRLHHKIDQLSRMVMALSHTIEHSQSNK